MRAPARLMAHPDVKIAGAACACVTPFLWAWLDPVQGRLMRGALVLGALGLLVCGLIFVVRNGGAGKAILALLALLLGAHLSHPPIAFDVEYRASLLAYDGAPYVWGGESATGIDCSGLIRRAVVDALVRRGLAGPSPSMLGEAAWQWWDDVTAQALGDPSQGRTVLLFESSSLRSVDHDRLQPGDIAVTANGAHVLAYVGERRWIQADPTVMHVHVLDADASNAWFHVPVRILRWRLGTV